MHYIGRMMLVTLCLAVGCARPPDGADASGKVTVDGKPLSGAVITFEPLSGTGGPNASAPILNGTFVVGSDASLRGGQYRVRISMIPTELRAKLPARQRDAMPPHDAVIHPQFDAESELTVELERGQTEEFEFDVHFLRPLRKP